MVVDDCTIPVAGARVLLIQVRPAEASLSNRGPAAVLATAVTDAQGGFRIEHARPGRYVLFVPAVGILQDAYVRGGYARAYYPAADTVADAVPIDLSADHELPSLTVTVSAVATQTISGHVGGGAESKRRTGELVMIQPDAPGVEVFKGTLASDGRFSIGGVPPGEYVLFAPLSKPAGEAAVAAANVASALRADVRVLDADVGGVVLTTDANAAR